VQKHLRALRDGTTDLYTTGAVNRMPKQKTESATTSTSRIPSPKQQKNHSANRMHKSYKAGAGIATHKRLRHCNGAKAKTNPS